jgi:hypothetical protein
LTAAPASRSNCVISLRPCETANMSAVCPCYREKRKNYECMPLMLYFKKSKIMRIIRMHQNAKECIREKWTFFSALLRLCIILCRTFFTKK